MLEKRRFCYYNRTVVWLSLRSQTREHTLFYPICSRVAVAMGDKPPHNAFEVLMARRRASGMQPTTAGRGNNTNKRGKKSNSQNSSRAASRTSCLSPPAKLCSSVVTSAVCGNALSQIQGAEHLAATFCGSYTVHNKRQIDESGVPCSFNTQESQAAGSAGPAPAGQEIEPLQKCMPGDQAIDAECGFAASDGGAGVGEAVADSCTASRSSLAVLSTAAAGQSNAKQCVPSPADTACAASETGVLQESTSGAGPPPAAPACDRQVQREPQFKRTPQASKFFAPESRACVHSLKLMHACQAPLFLRTHVWLSWHPWPGRFYQLLAPRAKGEWPKGPKQRFRHFVVYDFEATCTRARDLAPVEIIEVACVVVDAHSYTITGEFQSFVRPTQHPRLDPFCVELTGITQVGLGGSR